MQDRKYLTKEITSFLRSHSFISVNLIEKALDLPQSTIGQALGGKRLIPEKHLWNIIKTLAPYGLTIKGYSCKVTGSGTLKLCKKWRDGRKTEHCHSGIIFKVSYDLEEYRHTAFCLEDLDNLYTEDKNPYLEQVSAL